MSTKFVFNFNSKFLSATPMPAPHARRSKLMTRRAEMRTRRQWDCEESIVTAPAITDINVVQSVPELVSVVEMSVMPPAMVTHTEDNELAAALHQPVHADRDVVVPVPVEELNRGAVPEIDIASQRDEAAAMIVAANEIAVSASAIEIREPAPAVSPAADSGATPGSTAIVADVTPADVAAAPSAKPKRLSKKKKVDGCGGAKKKSRQRSGKLAGAAAIVPGADDQDRLPGTELGGTSSAHSPP
jgi:hypothetical protein